MMATKAFSSMTELVNDRLMVVDALNLAFK